MDIEDSINMSQDDVDKNLEAACEVLHKVQKQDKEYRVQYLIDLADHYAAENDVSRSTAIREFLVHEELREIYRKIGSKMKTKNSPQHREVWVQGDNEDEKYI